MLLPNERDYLIYKEQHETLIRKLELARLINELNHQRPSGGSPLHRKVITSLGSHLIKLGERLESYGRTASPGKLA